MEEDETESGTDERSVLALWPTRRVWNDLCTIVPSAGQWLKPSLGRASLMPPGGTTNFTSHHFLPFYLPCETMLQLLTRFFLNDNNNKHN